MRRKAAVAGHAHVSLHAAAGSNAMTSPHDPEPGRDSTSRNARDTSLTGDRARPHRMPVMGWIREISAVENWRTATIVRRHRDSAVTPTS